MNSKYVDTVTRSRIALRTKAVVSCYIGAVESNETESNHTNRFATPINDEHASARVTGQVTGIFLQLQQFDPRID